MLLNQAQRQASQQSEVLSAVPLLHPMGVFGKRHVHLPMQAVLDPPMIA
jgi:hypothetical protein